MVVDDARLEADRSAAYCVAVGRRRRRGDRRLTTGAWRQFRPTHDAIAIADLDRPVDRFANGHRAARRRMAALPLELEQPVVVLHHPIVRDAARLLEPEHVVEAQAVRDRDMKVVGRPRRPRESLIVLGLYSVSRRVGFEPSRDERSESRDALETTRSAVRASASER